MKVKQLKEKLEGLDDNLEIVMLPYNGESGDYYKLDTVVKGFMDRTNTKGLYTGWNKEKDIREEFDIGGVKLKKVYALTEDVKNR